MRRTPVYSCEPADEEDIVATMVRNSARLRRALAVASGFLLAVVTLLPSSAAAGRPGAASGPGVVTNITGALSGGDVERGDIFSSGWTLSMPTRHAAATVRVTEAVATIPLRCRTEKGKHEDGEAAIVVMRFHDVTLTIAANDTSWRPTAETADPLG